MASSKDIDDILQCCICLDAFEDPRALPCTHTFCLKCLQKTLTDKDPGDKGDCPLCKRAFLVPSKGMDGLPRNVLICQLLDAKLHVTSPTTEVPHQSSVNSTIHDEISAKERCEFHHKKRTELYCNGCQIAMCGLCVAVKHKTSKCDIISIEEAGEKFRKRLAHEISSVSVCGLQVQNRVHRIELTKKRFLNKVSKIEHEILERYEELLSLNQSHKSQLITELNLLKEKVSKQFEEDKREIEEDVMKRQSFVTSCKDLVDNGTVFDISSEANKLLAQAKLLNKMSDVGNDFSEIEVTFTANIPSPDSSKNCIGELFVKSGPIDDRKDVKNRSTPDSTVSEEPS